jgi:TRAP transporter TAXI family solute receptor
MQSEECASSITGWRCVAQTNEEEIMQKFTRRFVVGSSLAFGVTAGLTKTAWAQDGYKWPDYFTVVTPTVGTGNHSLAVAWTAEFSAQTGGRARVLPAPNGYARAEWLNSGEGDIALVQASDYFDQMEAVEGYLTERGGPSDTRLATMNLITAWGYMVRGDSDIKSFDDIKPGTRIALAASSSFLVSGIEALLAYRGLTRDDVEIVEVGNYPANTKIVVEGRADVCFTSPLSGTSYEAEAGPNGIVWLPLPHQSDDPEAFARYRAWAPGYVPAETTAGTKSAIGVYMDHAFQANHVRVDEDPEFVYQLSKWLDEHYDDFKDDYAHADMMSIASLKRFLEAGALQPLHDGTIRYLKEKDIWTDAYQARQDALVKLATDRVALWQEALADAKAQGITVSPESADFVALWDKKKKDAGNTVTFGEMVMAL